MTRLPELFKELPLFRSLLRTAAGDAPARRTFRDRLNAAPAGRRRALLDTFVQESVATILGVDAAALSDRRAGFSALGMDSLASVAIPEESLVVDDRCEVRPAQMVETKLTRVLGGSMLSASKFFGSSISISSFSDHG